MANELLKGDAKALGKVHPESRKAAQMSRAARKESNKGVRERQKDKHKVEQVRSSVLFVFRGFFFTFLLKGTVPSMDQKLRGKRGAHRGRRIILKERKKKKLSHNFLFLQKKNFSYAEVVDMLAEWASRYDDELADLRESEKKKTRELEVELLVEEERQKIRTGYSAPDLRMNKV